MSIQTFKAGEPIPEDWIEIVPSDAGRPFSRGTAFFGSNCEVETKTDGRRVIRVTGRGTSAMHFLGMRNVTILNMPIIEPRTELFGTGAIRVGPLPDWMKEQGARS